MREILFRGKTEKGEWVYGDLLHPDLYGNGYAIEDFTKEKNNCFDVIPESVSEFTGLKDKNGKRIFEGDIVKVTIVKDLGGGKHTKTVIGIVDYDSLGMLGIILYYHDNVPVWSDVMCELSLSGAIDDFWFEVIGNIHDNPELIGGGE